jgi:uncharacterized damage-inducible protein DinB
MTKYKFLLSALLFMGLSFPAFGAHHANAAKQTVFQESFLWFYGSETDKLVDLAEAFPEDGFEWRPAEGIRSVREAILHVATANFNIGGMLGKQIPEGMNPRAFEKSITGKTETLKVLKESIAFAKAAVAGLDEAGLNETIKFFGMEKPKMAAIILLGGHAEEHLGQLIAYARSTGVVPPWSK